MSEQLEEKKTAEVKLRELTPQEVEERKEYYDFVKNSAAEGSYFKDALDWYLVRYVNPLCDRTIMVCVALIAVISLYNLSQIFNLAFPLVQKVPIVIRAKDNSRYETFIRPLKDANDRSALTVDEAVAKYLLAVYVNERESYDYRKGDVNDVNRKFTHMKNTSSSKEYKSFQAFMSKDNPDSPANNFGRNIYRNAEIQSVNFIKKDANDYYGKLRNLLRIDSVSEAEVRFTIVTKEVTDEKALETRENYLAKINFDFTGVNRDAKSGNVDFAVTNYKLFKVK